MAPRITAQDIDDQIAEEQYHVFPNTLMTVCCLTLKNGYTVVGESACAYPENYNAEVGQMIAKDKAREKIWPLEGYMLKHAQAASQAQESAIPVGSS